MMQIERARWGVIRGWEPKPPSVTAKGASLVLVFGSSQALRDGAALEDVRRAHPGVPLFGCSIAGDARETAVPDESILVSVLSFDAAEVRLARARVAGLEDSHGAGVRLALALPSSGLTHVLVLLDGLRVDGAALVRGLAAALPSTAALFGAPSWDSERPAETLVVGGRAAELGIAAVVGLYGTRLRVGRGSSGEVPFVIEERPAPPASERDQDHELARRAAVRA